MITGGVQDESRDAGDTLHGTTQSVISPPTYEPDLPEKLLAALTSGRDMVVLSSGSCVGGPSLLSRISAEVLDATFPRLHEAGFATVSITAPLSLSVLHDAIRDALMEPAVQAAPLVVVIEHAENLLLATMHRLAALGALRRDGTAVLRFLLAGTPALWPALRGAGLAELEHDPVAHIPLHSGFTSTAPAVTRHRAPVRPAPGWRECQAYRDTAGLSLSRDSVPKHGRALAFAFMGFAGFVIAGAGGVAWIGLRPTPLRPSVEDRPTLSMRPEHRQIAGNRLRSPVGNDLMETRHRIAPQSAPRSAQSQGTPARVNTTVEAALQPPIVASAPAALVRKTLPAPTPPPAAAPSDDPIHVTVRYSALAAARAARVLGQLRSQGVLADGEVVSGRSNEHPGFNYYFAQDRPAAERLAQHLFPAVAASGLHAASGGTLQRPGEISITIGSRDDESGEPAPSKGPT